MRGQQVDPITYQTVLEGLGVVPDDFDECLEPVGGATLREDRAVLLGYDQAVELVAGWNGDSGEWMSKYGMEPLGHLGLCRERARSESDRDLFLLLEAHAAVKCGESGVGRFFDDRLGALVRVALGNSTWIGAAAQYLLGNVFAMMSVAGGKPPIDRYIAFAGQAYEYRKSVQPIAAQRRLLLPSLAMEAGEGIEGVSPEFDPVARSVPRPRRYLSANAIALADACWQRGNPREARAYLSAARQYVDEAGFRGGLDDPSGICLKLCEIVARVLEASLRIRGHRQCDLTALQREMDQVRSRLDRAYQSGVVSRGKYLEWLANTGFSEFALRRHTAKIASADNLLNTVAQAEEARKGRGQPAFRFDAIYEFALRGDHELLSEFRRIVEPQSGLGGPD